MSKHFSYNDAKYSGAEDENIKEYIARYQAVCRDLSLSPRERCQFVHNLFRGEALRFYNANVLDRTETLAEALVMMQTRFNSLSKQNDVKHELLSLQFSDFVSQCNGKRPLALRALTAHIEKRFPLCPDKWSTEAHKVEFLRQALLSEEWARTLLYRVTPATKLHELTSELGSILQIDEEDRAHTGSRDPANPETDYQSKPAIHYQRYGRRNDKK